MSAANENLIENRNDSSKKGGRIPLAHRGRRPRFFAAPGVDELLSAVLELTSEVWVTRQRLWLLEKAAAESGLDLAAKVESYRPTPAEAEALRREREALVASVLRALEADYVDRSQVQQEIDAAGAQGIDAAAEAANASTYQERVA